MRIKNTLSGALALLLAGIMLCPLTAMAAPAPIQEPPTEAVTDTQPQTEPGNIVEDAETRATGLIGDFRLTLVKNAPGKATIKGITACGADSGVTKCGFTYIRMQRRLNADYAWASYSVFSDLYANSYLFNTEFFATAVSGYEYRLMAEHYAYKNILSVEKSVRYTSAVAF